MYIFIATGIYPPDIGGPAEYAYNVESTFRNTNHVVSVKYFTSIERFLPMGFRHVYFALKSAYTYVRADHTLVLDTFSVALPIYLLSLCTGKRYTIRTGGDFLWESYVERTQRKVLLKDFYKTETQSFTKKEKFIYWITKKILARAEHVVFSTTWQRDIWINAYPIDTKNITIIENYYDISKKTKEVKSNTIQKVFVTGSRNLIWKNKDVTLRALQRLQNEFPEHNIQIDNNTYPHKEYMLVIEKAYAVVLLSLGDISPNTILDSIRGGTPFILTTENGITERVKDLGLFADPLSEEDVYEKLKALLDPTTYTRLQSAVQDFSFVHAWEDICEEYIKLWKR
jgi:glycosyltransferase involved in cell wall biosynthesis